MNDMHRSVLLLGTEFFSPERKSGRNVLFFVRVNVWAKLSHILCRLSIHKNNDAFAAGELCTAMTLLQPLNIELCVESNEQGKVKNPVVHVSEKKID